VPEERQRANTIFSCVQFFLTHVSKKKKESNDDNDKQNIRTEECTLSARGAKRDWRERIEAACYAGEPNRAGRVLETERRSILFFSHPSLRVVVCPCSATRGMLGSHACIRPTRFSSALVLPSGDMPHQRNTWTRSVMNFLGVQRIFIQYSEDIPILLSSVFRCGKMDVLDERPRSRACNYCNS